MTPAEKARETRQRHKEAQRAKYAAWREAQELTRQAMERVLSDPEATPEQLIQAAEILAGISH